MHLCLCGRGEDSSGCREPSSFWEELDELSVVFWLGGKREMNTDRMRGGNLAGHTKQTALVEGCHHWTNKKQEVFCAKTGRLSCVFLSGAGWGH